MVDIYITDSLEKYNQSKYLERILYLDGFIGECSFIDKAPIEDFNATLVGLDDEACRLMLIDLDADTNTIISKGLNFKTNRFIAGLQSTVKIHSVLFNFHKHFVVKKYLFSLVLKRFFAHFNVPEKQLLLELSDNYYLTQQLPLKIKSAKYYSSFNNAYLRFWVRQLYYILRRITTRTQAIKKTQVVAVLYDIHNEYDLFKRYMELAKKENKLDITILAVGSGNPVNKTVDVDMYTGGNIKVVRLYNHKANLFANYNSFYQACFKVNPLYKIFKKSRYAEWEDIQYGFVNNALSKLKPDVCLYVNVQEFGRVVANVCAHYNIPSICVEYAFAFDTFTMEKRIRFDARACMSEVTAGNWLKHKDPTPRHEVIGFCKIDDWSEKLALRQKAEHEKPFTNNKRTILFVSTWAPNPNSPLLTEKALIVQKLSDFCHQNGWNLLVKKHPSEFDTLVSDAFNRNSYPNQKIVEHSEMTLFDCVYYANFVCTQNSSAFIETLYLNKPFSYITANGDNLWARLSYFSREEAVGNFTTVEDYCNYLLTHADEKTYKALQDEFMKLQTKFLFKTDGRASERLLRLTETFVK